jgi:hypothetical protein
MGWVVSRVEQKMLEMDQDSTRPAWERERTARCYHIKVVRRGTWREKHLA